MSLVAATFILFALLLPGIAFRRFYYTGEFSRQYFRDGFGQLAFRVFVPAVLAQCALAGVLRLAAYESDLAVFVGVLAKAFNPTEGLGVANPVIPIARYVGWQAATIAVCGMLGYSTQYAVRRYSLDRRFKLFRFRNHWHYILRGGLRDFRQVKPLLPSGQRAVGMTFLQVLTATSEGDVLYDGLLADYELGPADQLERLVLMWVSRRFLHEDAAPGTQAERYRSIPGDFFVIPRSQIRNVNVRYFNAPDALDAAGRRVNRDGDRLATGLALLDADGDVSAADYFNQRG